MSTRMEHDAIQLEIAGIYTLGPKLGEGSYGCVFEARSKTGVCALKRMSMNSQSESAPKKALREVGILQRLAHPNIIRLQRAFFANKDQACTVLYLAFDHAGIDLRKYLAGQNGSQPEPSALEKTAWDLTRQLCRGVAFLHSVSVIHRDLKPENLMVSTNPAPSTLAFFLAPPCLGAMGSSCSDAFPMLVLRHEQVDARTEQLRIIDFGLARNPDQRDGNDAPPMTHAVLTRMYRAPEVILEAPYGECVDCWSVGCTLYEIWQLVPPQLCEGRGGTSCQIS